MLAAVEVNNRYSYLIIKTTQYGLMLHCDLENNCNMIYVFKSETKISPAWQSFILFSQNQQIQLANHVTAKNFNSIISKLKSGCQRSNCGKSKYFSYTGNRAYFLRPVYSDHFLSPDNYHPVKYKWWLGISVTGLQGITSGNKSAVNLNGALV